MVTIGLWFRDDLREPFADTLLSAASVQPGYFQTRFVRQLANQQQAGTRDPTLRLWQLVSSTDGIANTWIARSPCPRPSLRLRQLDSAMLKKAVISTLQNFFANRVYTVRHGLAKGLKRRGGLGFIPFPRGLEPSRREVAFLERLEFTAQTVYDIGGWEGIFTLFFARRIGTTGRLVTFEPNPRNYARIVENVRLNGFMNADVRRLAVGAKPGRASLVFPTDETARGSLVGDIQEQIQQEKNIAAIEVDVDTIDHQIALGLPEPDFVKIDVEGFERDTLEGMARLIARRRPKLYIEVHGANMQRKLENATLVVEYLWRAGYQIHHVESASTLDHPSSIRFAIEGHLYCQ